MPNYNADPSQYNDPNINQNTEFFRVGPLQEHFEKEEIEDRDNTKMSRRVLDIVSGERQE